MIISFYLVVAIICALLLIIMAAFADLGGDAGIDSSADLHMDMHMDTDASGADMHLDSGTDSGYGDFHGAGISPLSIPVILIFGTLFGSFGAFFDDMRVNGNLNEMLVPILAALIAVAITGLIYVVLVKFFVKSQSTTQVNFKDLVGYDGESTMPIKPGTPGQVMVITEERGRTLVRATSEVDIPTNTMVTVTGVAGNGVKVVPKKGGE